MQQDTPEGTPPRHRMGFRLVVKDIETTCPYGQPCQMVSDCYVRSAIPGHFCSNPTGQGRCDQVARLREQYGWRSWQVVPEQVCYTCGVRPLYPLKIIFSPTDPDGLTWVAINSMTGERKRVVLKLEWPYVEAEDGATLNEHPWSREVRWIGWAGCTEPWDLWINKFSRYLNR